MRVHTSTVGDGPLVVCIHDVGDDSSRWTDLQNTLSSAYQVVAFDLLGHGASPHPPDPQAYDLYSALLDIDDVVAHHRRDHELPTIIGHRFGASLARIFGQQRPGAVHRLVLIEPEPVAVDEVELVLANDTRFGRAVAAGAPELAAQVARLPKWARALEPTGVPSLTLEQAADEHNISNDNASSNISSNRVEALSAFLADDPVIDLRDGSTKAEPSPKLENF